MPPSGNPRADERDSFRLDLDYFDYCTGLKMTNERFDALFGGPARGPEEPFAQRHLDVAASVQEVIEEAVLRLTRSLREETGLSSLCLAGGVALNCVANGKVLRDARFDEIWVQPAAGDAGGALGAALVASHRLLGEPRSTGGPVRDSSAGTTGDAMQGAYLGPEFDQDAIRRALDAAGAHYETLRDDALIDATASALAAGKAVGWFQGRMEFGPRALGNRSILADARSPMMQDWHGGGIRIGCPSSLRKELQTEQRSCFHPIPNRRAIGDSHGSHVRSYAPSNCSERFRPTSRLG